MLWTAGQERTARERDARLVELFVTARDAALDVGVITGRLTAKGTWRLPAYVPTTPAVAVRRTPADRDRALAKLGAMFPGIVRRADS